MTGLKKPFGRRLRRGVHSAVYKAFSTAGMASAIRKNPDFSWDDTRPAVLFVDGVYPRTDRDSGSVDAFNFIRIFQDLGYRVFFIADTEFVVSSAYREPLERTGVQCISAPAFWSAEEFVARFGSRMDFFFLSRIDNGGRMIDLVRHTCPDARIVFNAVDLQHLREERRARVEGSRRLLRRAANSRRREFAAVRGADLTIVVSEAERQLLAEAVPGARIRVVPLIRDIPGRGADFSGRAGIGFVGGFSHRPNRDALGYFLDRIWPQVRRDLPQARFVAIGADMPADLRQRTDPGFVARGHVADLKEEMDSLRVTVAPLRYGAGAKGKVVTSLSYGVPCVASPIAAEGMNLRDGVEILLASDPAAFAARLAAVYTDEGLWNALSDAGLAFANSVHSYTAGRLRIAGILSELGLLRERERQCR